MFNHHQHPGGGNTAHQQQYRRFWVGQNCYQINQQTGSCRKMIPTGNGGQMRYVRSPLARAIGKSLKMGLGVGKDLARLIGDMERILGRGTAEAQGPARG